LDREIRLDRCSRPPAGKRSSCHAKHRLDRNSRTTLAAVSPLQRRVLSGWAVRLDCCHRLLARGYGPVSPDRTRPSRLPPPPPRSTGGSCSRAWPFTPRPAHHGQPQHPPPGLPRSPQAGPTTEQLLSKYQSFGRPSLAKYLQPCTSPARRRYQITLATLHLGSAPPPRTRGFFDRSSDRSLLPFASPVPASAITPCERPGASLHHHPGLSTRPRAPGTGGTTLNNVPRPAGHLQVTPPHSAQSSAGAFAPAAPHWYPPAPQTRPHPAAGYPYLLRNPHHASCAGLVKQPSGSKSHYWHGYPGSRPRIRPETARPARPARSALLPGAHRSHSHRLARFSHGRPSPHSTVLHSRLAGSTLTDVTIIASTRSPRPSCLSHVPAPHIATWITHPTRSPRPSCLSHVPAPHIATRITHPTRPEPFTSHY
jgi:hypothetical protein